MAVGMSLVLWKISNLRSWQTFGSLVDRVPTEDKVVALTFDDGPTIEGSSEVLSILRDHHVKATFFVTGAELESNPDMGRRIVEEGHDLGNHSWSHSRMLLKSYETIEDEIVRTDALIRKAGFDREIYFRPPYGKKLFTLPLVLKHLHKKTIMWSKEPDSGPEASTDQIVHDAIEHIEGGDIVLLHVMYPSRSHSLKAVPAIIEQLQEKGFRFLTVSQLLAASR